MTDAILNLPFNVIARRIGRCWDPFKRNSHMGFLSPSGNGKSYLIRHGILPISPGARTVVIDVKPGGDWKAWGKVGSGEWGNDVEYLRTGFGTGPNGTANYRLLVKTDTEDAKEQVKSVLELISAEGECTLVMDDSKKVTAVGGPNLGLSKIVDDILSGGRSQGITAILAANSNTWATSSLRDGCAVYFTGNMTNIDTRDKFANIIGLPRNSREVISSLPNRRFLYSDNWNGSVKLAITGLDKDARYIPEA